MGRYKTSAVSTEEVLRLELSDLIKNGLIQKGEIKAGTITWTNRSNSNIAIIACYKKDEKYIRLSYISTNNSTGETKEFNYKIKLATIPSNLGKGEVLYFQCPTTGKRARILYKCYGSYIWQSRKAYRYRIYYSSQMSGKYDHPNNEYFKLEKKINQLLKQRKKLHYQGNETRLSKRINYLNNKKREYDLKRMLVFNHMLNKFPTLSIK